MNVLDFTSRARPTGLALLSTERVLHEVDVRLDRNYISADSIQAQSPLSENSYDFLF